MLEKFQPQANVQEIIALQFPTGRSVVSKLTGNPEVQYTLQDGRTWYVDPAIARKVDELSLGKGELFAVTKVKKGKGFTFEVRHMNSGAGCGRQDANVSTPRQALHSAATPTHEAPRPMDVPSNGVSDRAPAGKRLMAAFLIAIDAVAEAQAYADRKTLGVKFTSEDLTSVALGVFANFGKGERG